MAHLQGPQGPVAPISDRLVSHDLESNWVPPTPEIVLRVPGQDVILRDSQISPNLPELYVSSAYQPNRLDLPRFRIRLQSLFDISLEIRHIKSVFR